MGNNIVNRKKPPMQKQYAKYCRPAVKGNSEKQRKGCHVGVYEVYQKLRKITHQGNGKAGPLKVHYQYAKNKKGKYSHLYTYSRPRPNFLIRLYRRIRGIKSTKKYGELFSIALNSDLSALKLYEGGSKRAVLRYGNYCDVVKGKRIHYYPGGSGSVVKTIRMHPQCVGDQGLANHSFAQQFGFKSVFGYRRP